MGLFDKLAREVKDKLGSETINDIKEKLENAIEDVTGVDVGEKEQFCSGCGEKLAPGAKFCTKCGTKTAQAEPVTPAPQTYASSAQSTEKSWEYATYSQVGSDVTAKFEAILAKHFSSYTIGKWQSAAQLGFTAADPSREYDFVLSNGAKPTAVILLTPKGRDRNKVYINTKAAAEAAGVKVINFFTNFPNEEAYVVERIHKFIG